MLQLITALGALCGTYVSLLAEGMGKYLDNDNEIVHRIINCYKNEY